MSLDNPPYLRGAEKLAQRIRTVRENTGIALSTPDLLNRLVKANLRRFDREVDPSGNRWEVRAHDPYGRTDRRGAGRGTLIRTGKMRASIGIIRGFSKGSLAVATGANGRIGILASVYPDQARYGRFHQFGIGVPKRTFLGIAASDVVMIDSALRRAIIRQSGLE